MSISPELIEEYFQRYQWSYTRSSENTWITGVRTTVSSFRIFIRVSEHWIYFVINPFVVSPPDDDDRLRLYYHILRMNLDMNMAKFGIDSDGDIFLAVELPTESFEYSHFSDALNGISHHAERLYSEVFNLAHNPTLLNGRYDHELGLDEDDDEDLDDDMQEDMDDEVSRILSTPLDDVGLGEEEEQRQDDEDDQGPIIAGKEVRIVNGEDGSVRIEFETAHDFDDVDDDIEVPENEFPRASATGADDEDIPILLPPEATESQETDADGEDDAESSEESLDPDSEPGEDVTDDNDEQP